MTMKQETIIYADADKFGILASTRIIAIKIGEPGFYTVEARAGKNADWLNTPDITPEIVESAIAGSMFGWNVPAAQAAVRFHEGEN